MHLIANYCGLILLTIMVHNGILPTIATLFYHFDLFPRFNHNPKTFIVNHQ